MPPSILDDISRIPPVTRFLCASTLGISLPVMLKMLSPYSILFMRELVTQRLELWRPFTSMFFAGTGLNFIFDFIMLYRNSESLESIQFTGLSSDYAWQLMINAVSILCLNMPLRSMFHFRPLLLSLITLSSRLTPNALTSIFGLFTLSQAYLPYALVALDLLVSGPQAAASSLTGVISGYSWWYLVHNADAGRPGAEFARAPSWLRTMLDPQGERAVPGVGRILNEGRARAATARRTASRATSGGHNWGSGNRLGSG